MMRMKSLGIFIVAVAVLSVVGCKKEQPKQQPPDQGAMPGSGAVSTGATNVAGVQWSVPQKWMSHPASGMRVASYIVPPAADSKPGECAVFYFGKNQGGSVDDNIGRWVGQFEKPRSDRSTKTVNGMNVTLVQITGIYLTPGGPMMESQGKQENYKLLGAIVEAPEGLVFFKFTGPAKTMAVAERDFDALVASLAKVGT